MKLPKPFKYLLIIPAVPALLFILLFVADFAISSQKNQKIQYGVTFSPLYAEELGLDPDEVYQNILNNLGVNKLRIPVYWKEVEESRGAYDFSNTDHLLDLARDKNAKVILVIGHKVPRWPECFPPTWTSDISESALQQSILSLLDKTVEHFQNRPEVVSWQIENEPLLDFGVCRKLDSAFLNKEVDLVRSKDKRPIIITDSGELSSWIDALRLSDKMGTTMYRTVWNPMLGYLTYPFPPLFYPLKQAIVGSILNLPSKEVFVVELQAEPWPPGKSLAKTTLSDQLKIFPITQLKDSITFGRKTGFAEQYLWGVEWWYYMKTQGHPEYWEHAKTLFK